MHYSENNFNQLNSYKSIKFIRKSQIKSGKNDIKLLIRSKTSGKEEIEDFSAILHLLNFGLEQVEILDASTKEILFTCKATDQSSAVLFINDSQIVTEHTILEYLCEILGTVNAAL